MVHRPPEVGAFQFVILSALRSAQLVRGCTPKVDGIHKPAVTAQLEVSTGRVAQQSGPTATLSAPGHVPQDDAVPSRS